jgi:predicted nucleic acid-binding protein
MILVDSSVWIEHIRSSNSHLVGLLKTNSVAMHPWITGEIACGNLARRATMLALLKALPQIQPADEDEVLFFLDRHRLAGKGIGYIDVHLLAAAAIASIQVWTADKRLARVAAELGLQYLPPPRS